LTVNPDKYDMLFNKISPKALDRSRALISLDKAYKVYAQPIIATESRDFLSQFSIDEIAGNRDTVSTKLARKLTQEIQDKTPFIVRYAALSDVDYPEIILKAQQRAAARREQI